MYDNASTEPLELIRANECDHPNSNDLATMRFRAFWNEIERLTSDYKAARLKIDYQGLEIERLRAALDSLIPGYEQFIIWAQERRVFNLKQAYEHLGRAKAIANQQLPPEPARTFAETQSAVEVVKNEFFKSTPEK